MSNDEEDSIVETDSPGSDFMTGLTSIYDSRGTPVSIDITLFRNAMLLRNPFLDEE